MNYIAKIYKKNFLFFFLSLLCLTIGPPTLAQNAKAQRTVTGVVLDSEKKPIPGVSISIDNKATATLTDDEGKFKLTNIASTARLLTFSHIGYDLQRTVLVATTNNYTINLKDNSSALEEIVVVGYGTVKRKDLTGSIGEVKIEDMQKAPVGTFAEALAGRVAGVQVISGDGQPGADLQIIVRGNNSVTQDNSPLYVLDGFPVEEPISNVVNPEEIQSIEILKDASATAIYGARGANGVIMITTKKGKIGEPKVNYQGWTGLHQSLKQQEMMSAYEFVRLQLEKDPTTFTPMYLNNGKTLESYRNAAGINWQDLVIQDGWAQNHNIAVRGGTSQTKYAISASAFNQKGIIVNSGFRRYQGRAVLDQNLGKFFKIGLNINYSTLKRHGQIVADPQDGGATASLMYSIWGYRPVSGKEDESSLLDQLLDDDLIGTDYRTNPLVTTQNEYNPQFTNSFIANSYLEIKPIKDITVRITGGATISNSKKEIFNNSKTRSGNPIGLIGLNGSINNIERNNLLNENTVTYNKKIGKNHNLTVLGGLTFQQLNSSTYGFRAIQLINESLGISGIDEGIISALPSGKSESTLMSYLGRVNYNYKSKYLLTASFRADGSSKFRDGNKWSYFPSGSVAWRISQEKFIKQQKWISDAKLRVGYGLTGNNRVGDFPYFSPLGSNLTSAYTMGNSVLKGVIPLELGNEELEWETTEQLDIGLDLSLFKNRVQFTTDYYHKKTRNLLLQATIAPSSGYLTGLKNVGSVANKGWEFTLNSINIQNKNFSWNSSLNISFNRNKVLQLNDGETSMATRVTWSNYGNAYPYIAIPGQPIAQFYGYVFDGIYQLSDFNIVGGNYELKPGIPNNGTPAELIEPGYIRYKDVNGDGIVDSNDMTIIGNPNPQHIGGFINNFTYKGIDLSIFLQWSYGNDLMNANRYEFEGSTGRSMLNQFAAYANRWSPENPSNTMFKLGGQGPLVYSDRTVEDGSFLRLKTVSLGYTFPKQLSTKIGISTLRIYAAAQNLAVWTNYSGMDPEVSVRPIALTPGFDWSAYPRTRTITLGLNVNF